MKLQVARRIKGCIKSIDKKIDNYKEVRKKHGVKGLIYCIVAEYCTSAASGCYIIGKRFVRWSYALLERTLKGTMKKSMQSNNH